MGQTVNFSGHSITRTADGRLLWHPQPLSTQLNQQRFEEEMKTATSLAESFKEEVFWHHNAVLLGSYSADWGRLTEINAEMAN